MTSFVNDQLVRLLDLIEAFFHSPDPSGAQRLVWLLQDFPNKWVAIVDKVRQFIQTNDINTWNGALQAYYQLCKIYEYKSAKDREPYHKAMRVLLPMFLERLSQLSEDQSDISVVTQKQILKIFFTFIQFILPLDVLDKHNLSSWIEICHTILAKPVPDSVEQIDTDERPKLSCWKIKEWAIRILEHVAYSYGTPSNAGKEYAEFADYFIKSYATKILTTVLKILEEYRNGVYVSPRVLQQSIFYIEYAVLPAVTWTILKQHMLVIIQEVLYPLMCHSDKDEDLFQNDPIEYIKMKYDVSEDFLSPVNAARQLVFQVANKHKQMLGQTMLFCMQTLQNNQLQPRQKDGILHIIGAVALVIIKKKMYKEQVEIMLTTYVFPEFQSQHGFMRARAFWILSMFPIAGLICEENLILACNYIINCLLNDPCLPVSVEACVALTELIDDDLRIDQKEINPKVRELIGQNIQPIILKMLNLIRDTENDDVSNVVLRLIVVYEDEITKYSVEIMQQMADTFLSIVKFREENQESEASDDKHIAAKDLLSAMESILHAMEGKLEIMGELEKLTMPIIYAIIQNGMIDFYEELIWMIYDLTSKQVSDQMWNLLFLFHDIFQNDAADYFVEMMSVLHNYVTVDTTGQLADPKRIEVMFKMIKHVLTNPTKNEVAESHAAKLLEIIILQCQGKIDQVLPTFLQLVLERLGRGIHGAEIRIMCLQVVVAALWSNTDCVLQTFDQASAQQGRSYFMEFLQKWFIDLDNFFGLHERKMCLLGICTLLKIATKRPHDVAQLVDKLLPNSLVLLEGLVKVYAIKDKEDSDDELEDSDGDIEDDEDEEDDDEKKGSQKTNGVNRKKEDDKIVDEDSGVDESDLDPDYSDLDDSDLDDSDLDDSDLDDSYSDLDGDDDDKFYPTLLESYKSCIDENDEVDEFIIFRDTLKAIQTNEPQYMELLTRSLTPDQAKSIQGHIRTANKRQAEQKSRKNLND